MDPTKNVGMTKLFHKIASITAFYTIANGIEALSPIFLAIILTRLVSPQDYGLWVLFISVVTFLRPIVNLSIQDALKMRFYEMDGDERSRFVLSALFLSSASALLLAVVFWLFGGLLSQLLKFPLEWMISIVFAAYLYACFYFILAFNQFAELRARFIGLQFLQTISGFTIIAFLVYQGFNWQGVIVGKIAGLLIACGLGLYWLSDSLKFKFVLPERREFLRMIRFGLLYLPAGFGLVAVPLTDRLIVSHLLGLDQNGLYGVAALFGSALYIVINGFLFAWMPWLFKRLGQSDENYKKEVSAISAGFIVLLPILGVIFYGVAVIAAPVLIGEAFKASFSLIPWAIAGTISMGYFYHNQAFLHFRKAVVGMSVSSLVCIILNAILSYYGALHYGVTGVLAATIGAFISAALISGMFAGFHAGFFGNRFVNSSQSAG